MSGELGPQQESVTVGQFSGINNRANRERLKLDELAAAVNVDLDDAGQLHRRRGFTKKLTGSWHSAFTLDARTFAVKDQYLGLLQPGYAFTPIAWVGDNPLTYAEVNSDLYYASGTAYGRITPQNTWLPWGSPDGQAIWLSPVVDPTDTLGEVDGKLLAPAPVPGASIVASFKGRIYMAVKDVLWATELYAYDWVDRLKNFIPFNAEITMVQPVTDGIYVGTERSIFFIQGSIAEGYKRINLVDVGVIRGSDTVMPANKVYPLGRGNPSRSSSAILFMAQDGIYAGFDGGEAYNLTTDKVVFPTAVRGAALFREQDGVNQYIATMDSAGTPASRARIGDFIDAEIIRFQGG